eukprot:scaffold196153_cov18-Tisochrysis_lutea.AAC.2
MQSPVQQFCATCRSMGHAYCRISDLTSCRSRCMSHGPDSASCSRFNLLLFKNACLMDQNQHLEQQGADPEIAQQARLPYSRPAPLADPCAMLLTTSSCKPC